MDKIILTGISAVGFHGVHDFVSEEIFKNFHQAKSVVVVVHKPEAPLGAEILDVAVRIERTR